jgi:phage terminase large subunit
MVRELFGVEPEPWQEQALDQFPGSPRIAVKASKGCGKTTVEAWLTWHFLLTRPHPKIACTAIDSNNLADNL